MERGEGRNRSELPDLDARLLALSKDLASLNIIPRTLSDERALLFTAEAYAWSLFQRLRAQLFESRLDMPKNDSEVFSILQKHELVDLVEARKLRQFCELRLLSSRDLAKLDLAGVRELVSDLSWIDAILVRLRSRS